MKKRVPKTLIITDWKSGRIKRHAHGQLMSYAHAARAKYGMPSSGVITIFTVWLRFAAIEVLHVSDDDIDAFTESIKAQEKAIGDIYIAGEHCEFCKLQNECEACADYSRSAATSLAVFESETAITPQLLAELYEPSRALTKALKKYDTALKLAVGDGELTLPDGRVLRNIDRIEQRLTARPALGILKAAGFSTEEIDRCISMQKTAVMDIAGKKAPARGKVKARAALTAELVEAGAMVEKIKRVLTASSPKPQASAGAAVVENLERMVTANTQ